MSVNHPIIKSLLHHSVAVFTFICLISKQPDQQSAYRARIEFLSCSQSRTYQISNISSRYCVNYTVKPFFPVVSDTHGPHTRSTRSTRRDGYTLTAFFFQLFKTRHTPVSSTSIHNPHTPETIDLMQLEGGTQINKTSPFLFASST